MDTFKSNNDYKEDENQPLPGFRFHPTDEELVGFYLRGKVDKNPMKIDHLIQEINLYKHDPWDLPKINDGEDTKDELYFFCKRGRKYKNSERPNRVTGSGFWKATGIDRPIYNSLGGVGGHESRVVGLKKTLVYYRGSAGKGTKTDWMMHELRLPNTNNSATMDKSTTQEAEVWTVCRIFSRSHKSYVGDWRELPSKQLDASKNKSCKMKVGFELDSHESYISFASPKVVHHYDDDKMSRSLDHHTIIPNENKVHMINEESGIFAINDSSVGAPSASTSSSSYLNPIMDMQMDQQFSNNYETWDELRYVVDQFTLDSNSDHL